jgi:hypothetical protein
VGLKAGLDTEARGKILCLCCGSNRGGWDQNGSYADWLGRGVEWIQLAQDRGRWWAVVNTVMNLWVPVPWSK